MSKAIPMDNFRQTERVDVRRNNLRPITITGGEHKGQTGYVVQFGQTYNFSDGVSFVALVELEEGTLTSIKSEFIKYNDVPTKQ